MLIAIPATRIVVAVNVYRVAAVTFALFFLLLLRCSISVPSRDTLDKRIPSRKFAVFFFLLPLYPHCQPVYNYPQIS
jgi:hypothetical protein